jgi:peroxiredoxin
VQLFPTLFLVDKDGVIRAHFVNYKEEAMLQQAIEKVL